jgi:hypothetical protein
LDEKSFSIFDELSTFILLSFSSIGSIIDGSTPVPISEHCSVLLKTSFSAKIDYAVSPN